MNLDRGWSRADCDCIGVNSLCSSVDVGVGWKDNGVRDRETRGPRITLTGNVELLDLGPSSGLREKSFAIAPHPKPIPLPTDLLELETELFEPEPELLFEWKIPVDILRFSLFSTAELIVGVLSLGFDDLNSVVVGSGLSWIASWTTSRSSEVRPISETFPSREDRDFPLIGLVIIASILSLLSSSIGVGMVEKLEVVIVGDSAGRLDLVISECTLCLLPRAISSVISSASLAVRLTTIGGSRLLSRGDKTEGILGDSADAEEGELGRGTLGGSTVSVGGTGGSDFTIQESIEGNS